MLEPPSWHARFGEAMFARRVITAVLLLIAGIVSPGVCDACPQTGCRREAAASNSDPVCPGCRGTGTAAVADSGCHETPFSGQPRGGMEAGDGPSNSCDFCRCMLAPRDSSMLALRGRGDRSPSAPLRGELPVDAAIAVAVADMPFLADPDRLSAADLLVGSLLPSRPARVLFGVWRN